ncbi:ATPase, T2SS/T4P/T4SS family [Marinomonas sp. TI.3.20]|uniref:ATPase, T2SS/T4P/T4SS family n=1 Tax=Marinomonas sp. TI.3.20 TaxID=3121296 RepID=UPI00311F6FA6
MNLSFIESETPYFNFAYQGSRSEQKEWDYEAIFDLLVSCFHNKDVSDIYLAHDAPIIIQVSGDNYIANLNNTESLPEMLEVDSEVLENFYERNHNLVTQLTKQRKSSSGNLVLKPASGEKIRFRLEGMRWSNGPAVEGNDVCLRPLRPPTLLKDLNVSEFSKRIVNVKEGIVFVNGPTGSGKSTYLAAILVERSLLWRDMIYTAEDPCEYDMQNIRNQIGFIKQHDANNDSTGGFAACLKSFLRKHPKAILLGEMRDQESVKYGILTAKTKHQLFTTLHCDRPWQIYERLLDEMPDSVKSSTFRDLIEYSGAIVSQRLIKTSIAGTIAIQDVFYFTENDKLMLVEAAQSSFKSNGDFSGFGYKFIEIFKEKCDKGEALSMSRNLKEHYDNGKMTEEEYTKILSSMQII